MGETGELFPDDAAQGVARAATEAFVRRGPMPAGVKAALIDANTTALRIIDEHLSGTKVTAHRWRAARRLLQIAIDRILQAAEDRSPSPDFDGDTYDPGLDKARLTKQLGRVFECMKDGKWRTIPEISTITGDPMHTSLSARLRDLRKRNFGSYIVDEKRQGDGGLFMYRLRDPKGDPLSSVVDADPAAPRARRSTSA